MPELPEVETVANGVHVRVAGERIRAVWCSGMPQTFKTPPGELQAGLTGCTIDRVRRVGKHVVVSLRAEAADRELLVHLGMTGRLLVSHADVPMPLHTHLRLCLEDGREVRFVDARRFGRLELRRIGEDGGFAGPGLEPLTVPPEGFVALFHGRTLPIKAALLNQSLLQGVGNIYADESLYRAGIRPTLAAGKVSRARLLRLHAELQAVLLRAIDLGGSSVSDYVDADGVRGFFQLEHQVYRRQGLPCGTCGTLIRRTVVGGRSTHSCARCQK